MGTRFHTVRAAGIAVTLDLSIGHLRDLKVAAGAATLAPLHLAPWADDADAPREETSAPNLMGLGGDFLCAPFGLNDVEPAPPHGWPANSAWRLESEVEHPRGGTVTRFMLDRPVLGARVVKELTLRDGHPFLYQRHLFEGGSGAITVSHHANAALPEGARLAFSAKAHAETPKTGLETDPARGRGVLAYPARSADLTALPLAEGGSADLTRYPIGEGHEDFVMLVEAPGSPLGWTAALRAGSRDILLVLKNPAVLPVTLLWYSNGGRFYPPWNGRHTGVLGIEDARCWSAYGHGASIADNPLAASGVPTCFHLKAGGVLDIRQVIGACAAPEGWDEVAAVEAAGSGLAVRAPGGETVRLSYDAGFLSGL